MEILEKIPHVLLDFLLTAALALVIGLEQKKRREDEQEEENSTDIPAFGTDRTFAFIGVFGFIAYILAPQSLVLFTAGAVILAGLLGVFYYTKIKANSSYGLTSIFVAFITYSLGPVIITQPKWLTVLIVVSVLILVERKKYFENITKKIDADEFTTLAKFLLLAFVILPLVPTNPPIPVLNISPYAIWLTVVIVSAISYISYLLQTYFFKESGVLITGLLGGLYSSTATTVIVSKRSREIHSGSGIYASSIILANAMMYLRVAVLMFIFNRALAMFMLPYLVILILTALVLAGALYYRKKPAQADKVKAKGANPLELKVALLFAGLFILFSFLTNYTLSHFGVPGLDALSFVTGFTDIDPFLLNLFQGKFEIPLETIGRASLQAIISNNILKSIYILSFAESNTKKTAGIAMGIITGLTIVFVFII
jgi:uncharacterized membrane protein (DUF4010 family)